MKTNEALQKDVQDAIKWEPLLNAAEIGVTVKGGVVSLTGIVDSYSKKLEAETATKNVAGVKAVAENIEVQFGNAWNRSNAEIADAVLAALKTNWSVPDDKVQVTVENGWVTLSGDLPWNYQRDAAKNAVNYLTGVKGVTNSIVIKSDSNEKIEKEHIVAALARNWSVNDRDIRVEVTGHEVTLTGTVLSYYQRDEAGNIAWKTPGIWAVHNDLAVEWDS